MRAMQLTLTMQTDTILGLTQPQKKISVRSLHGIKSPLQIHNIHQEEIHQSTQPPLTSLLKIQKQRKEKEALWQNKKLHQDKSFQIDNSILRQNDNGAFKEEDNAKLSSSELLKKKNM